MNNPIVTLVNWTPEPLFSIESAASVCYNSPISYGGKTMMNCYDSGHHSVMEHTLFTFHITGVSRAMLAQITRHRLAAFSVRSQRYCREDEFEYVTPPSIENNEAAKELYQQTMRDLDRAYDGLISIGIPEEDARYILPNACHTVIRMSVNFRELMHICNERMCMRAQWEIRNVVRQMADEVIEIFPEAKRMLVPKCERLGVSFCTEKHGCGRHQTLEELFKIEHRQKEDHNA